MCSEAINLMAHICNLYAGTLKCLPLIPAGLHRRRLSVNILIVPVSHSWGVWSSALIYSLYQSTYLLPGWLNRTPGIHQLLSQ